jgi:hypothetical protein
MVMKTPPSLYRNNEGKGNGKVPSFFVEFDRELNEILQGKILCPSRHEYVLRQHQRRPLG